MKRTLPAVCLILCAALACGIVLQASAAAVLRRELSRRFPQARVRVAGCSLWPLSLITVRGVEISRGSAFHCSADRIRLRYILVPSRRPLQVSLQLDDVLCEIISPDRPLAGVLRALLPSGAAGAAVVERIVLERCRLSLQTADLSGDIRGNAVYDPSRKLLRRADAVIPALRWGPVQVRHAAASVDLSAPAGFWAQSVAVGNAAAERVSASAVIVAGQLRLLEGRGGLFGGNLFFNAAVNTGDPQDSLLRLRLEQVDVAAAVNAFKWQEKLRASGSLDGDLLVRAAPGQGVSVSGSLLARQPGGSLDIRDPRFLEYLAQGSGQPVEMIARSLRDYRYDRGTIALSRQAEGFVFRTLLSGPQGRRDLTVVLHETSQGG